MRLAQQNRAASPQRRDDGGVGRAEPPFVNRRSELRRQSSRLHDVLGGEWNLRERAVAERPLWRDLHPCVNRVVHLADALEALRHRKLAVARRCLDPLRKGLDAGILCDERTDDRRGQAARHNGEKGATFHAGPHL